MARVVSISEQIIDRWFDKLKNDDTVPEKFIEGLELLRKQSRLSNVESLSQLQVCPDEGKNGRH